MCVVPGQPGAAPTHNVGVWYSAKKNGLLSTGPYVCGNSLVALVVALAHRTMCFEVHICIYTHRQASVVAVLHKYRTRVFSN